MKKHTFQALLLSFLLFFISLSTSYAQFPGGGGGGMPGGGSGYPGSGGNSNGSKSSNGFQGVKMPIGHIYGKIVDAKTKKGVEFASVALYTLRTDSLVGGQLTETNGDFSLENLTPGGYKLKITFIGFTPVEQKVIVTPANAEQDLGNLALTQYEKTLNTVTLTCEKSTLELKPDRKVFNVDKDLSARGGDAVDVMKNIPGVSTDADGNVTLRNNTPIIYVDGKPTSLTLEQIPADQIDKVEVITNPSAKFEAAATGGIINIVLKKNQQPGYNGLINMSLGTNDQYNGMAMINVREKKFGFMLSYNVRGSTDRVTGYTDRTTLSNDAVTGYFNQNDNVTSKRLFQVGRVGFDYYINNRNTLSFSENGTFGNFNTGDVETYSTRGANDSLLTNGLRNSTQTNSFRNFTTDLSFRHTYPKADKEWTLDLNYNHSNGTTGYTYNFTNYSDSGSLLPYNLFNPQLETETGSSHTDMITTQWDFTDPIAANMKLEFGARLNYQRQYSSLRVIDSSNNIGELNTSLSNTYQTDNLISAAYVSFTHTIRHFTYQIGLRLEQTYFNGTLLNKGDSSFSYQYPSSIGDIYNSLFPSLNVSQKFGDKYELQFNVTRKIKRPNFFQISPFIFASDKYDYQIGNASLRPEFDNKAEINFNVTLKSFNWLTSLYGSYNQDPITQYSYAQSDSSQILINTFINGLNSYQYGWENTIKVTPVKGLDITADGNVFNTNINSNVGGENISNSGISWMVKGIISYKFPGGVTGQVNGTYEAPRIIAQGHILAQYFFDISASKDFGIVSLNFTISDVMNSRSFGTYEATSTFDQTQLRRRTQRYARLGMNIKFGKMDSSIFSKLKKKKAGDTGGEDMEY